jgi:hypothetical protein
LWKLDLCNFQGPAVRKGPGWTSILFYFPSSSRRCWCLGECLSCFLLYCPNCQNANCLATSQQADVTSRAVWESLPEGTPMFVRSDNLFCGVLCPGWYLCRKSRDLTAAEFPFEADRLHGVARWSQVRRCSEREWRCSCPHISWSIS